MELPVFRGAVLTGLAALALISACAENTTHPFPAEKGGSGGHAALPAPGGGTAGRGGASTGGTSGGTGGTRSAGGALGGAGSPLAGTGGGESGGRAAEGKGGNASGAGGNAGGTGGNASATGGKAAEPTEGGEGGEGGEGTATSGGTPGSGGAKAGEEVPPGYVKGIVAVGYGGLRVVSRDDGKSWSDAVDFGKANADDENLLRAVTYGKGRWIATGWRLLYSDDGVSWTQHSMVRDEFDNQQIIEGLAYKDGYFYAAGDPGRFYRSTDGLDWESYGERIGNTEKHTALAYRGGVFVSYGDSSTSFRSADGTSWEQMTVNKATYCEGQWRTLEQCHDAAWFDGGFYLRVEWGGDILRSTNGSSFQRVYKDPDQHTAYKTITFAEGYVAP